MFIPHTIHTKMSIVRHLFTTPRSMTLSLCRPGCFHSPQYGCHPGGEPSPPPDCWHAYRKTEITPPKHRCFTAVLGADKQRGHRWRVQVASSGRNLTSQQRSFCWEWTATRLTYRKCVLQIFQTWHFSCLLAVLQSIHDQGNIFWLCFVINSPTWDSTGKYWRNLLKVCICEELLFFQEEQWFWIDLLPCFKLRLLPIYIYNDTVE